MLDPAASARSNTSSSAGSSAAARDAAGRSTCRGQGGGALNGDSCAQAVAAACLRAGGARSLRRRTRSRTRARAPVPSGIPLLIRARRSAGDTCRIAPACSRYVAFLRRVAVANAARLYLLSALAVSHRVTRERLLCRSTVPLPKGVTP